MAQKDRSTLKSFFETGDIPTEGNYTDLIDSSLSLAEGNTGNINLTGEITASGNISSSGTLTAESLSITNIITTHVTASSISSSGDLIASRILINEGNGIFFDDSFGDSADPDFPQKIIGQDNLIQVQADNFFNVIADETRFVTQSGENKIILNHITGDVTASGNISASGTFFVGDISSSGVVSGSQGRFSGRVITNDIFESISGLGIRFDNNITASSATGGNISASGQITANKVRAGNPSSSDIFDIAAGTGGIDTDGSISCTGFSNSSTSTLGGRVVLTGASAYIETPSYVSSSKIITGDITSSGNIITEGVTLVKIAKGGIGNYGDVISADGQSTTFQVSNIPIIPGKADNKIGKSAPTFIRNTNVNQTSTIIVTCLTDQLSATAFGNATATAVANAGYFISLGNESTDAFAIGSASFSALIF